MQIKDAYTIIIILLLLMFIHMEFIIRNPAEFGTGINKTNHTESALTAYKCYGCSLGFGNLPLTSKSISPESILTANQD